MRLAPYRMEFWGDEIDTISTFDLDSQRRIDTVKEALITPAREVLYPDNAWLVKRLGKAYDSLRGKQGVKAKEILLTDMEKLEAGLSLNSIDKFLPLIYPQPATLLDYLPEAGLIFCEMVSVKEASKTSMWQHYEDVSQLLQEGVLFKGCDTFAMEFPQVLAAMEGRPCAILENFARSLPEVRLSELVSLNAVALSPWSGDLKLLEEDLDSFLRREYRVAVLAGTDKAAAALRDDLIARHIPVSAGGRELDPGKVGVFDGDPVRPAWSCPELKFALITHGKAAAKTVRRKKSEKARVSRSARLSDLALRRLCGSRGSRDRRVRRGSQTGNPRRDQGLHQNPLCGNRHVVCPCDPTGSGKQIHRPQRG